VVVVSQVAHQYLVVAAAGLHLGLLTLYRGSCSPQLLLVLAARR
jgi:hypothetical protein